MIVRAEAMHCEKRKMRGGAGECQVLDMLDPKQVPHGRLFSTITIEKGCSIGSHEHVKETEYYYILSGQGIVTESDGVKMVKAGDMVVTGGGASHAIRNEQAEPLVFVALILFD